MVQEKRDDGSQVVDAVLERDPALRLPLGFDQLLFRPQQCARTARPPALTGLSRALTASKLSPLHCRDVVISCFHGVPRYILPEHLDVSKVDGTVTWQGRLFRPTIIGKRTRETLDTSVQSILEGRP